MAKNTVSELQKFLSNLPKRPKRDTCWEWCGGFFKKQGKRRYGAFCSSIARVEGAHRASYRLFKGPIPPGKHVLHTCDNPACCNPSHLRLGTNLDNMQDRDRKGRGCRPGHPDHPQTKLLPALIYVIQRDATRRVVAKGTTYGVYAEIAREYGVSSATISRVCGGLFYHYPTRLLKGMTTRWNK